jgi:LysR family transcriptional regulator, glycine cleavage system transcriptional activator
MSFTKAAEELHVTQSAVSRQVAQTEEYLGLLLFQRVRQRIVLTDAGQQYAKAVRAALEQIQSATVTMLAHKGSGGALNIATPAAFATKWLIPRLSRFYQAHPGVMINLSTRDLVFDLEREQCDAAFHYGSHDWADVISEPLVGREFAVVCSPEYLSSCDTVRTPADLRRHVLLQHSRRPNQWREWFKAAGAKRVDTIAGPRFEHFYMIMQAALAHLGTGLVPRLLVEDDLVAGRLVEPVHVDFIGEDAYCLVYAPSKRNDPRLEQFRRWLHSEANQAAPGIRSASMSRASRSPCSSMITSSAPRSAPAGEPAAPNRSRAKLAAGSISPGSRPSRRTRP